MELHHLINPYYLNVNPPPESAGDRGRDRDRDRDRDRFPQWTHDETKEFLAIRAELDRSFMETKRNKPLWQAISVRLERKGFNRTPEQCKSKWKNLVTRFKGSEATEGEGSRQFPFYEEMRRIFSERMEKLLALNKDKGKGVQVQGEDQWGEEEEEQEEEKLGESKKKRKVERKRGSEGEVENALREFARRQLEMETRWIEAAEAREAERRAKEEEWRRAMEALEEERIVMETRWREREEERRAREEARAERRDALVTALLAKLRKEGL